jgi:hypothetical protein
LVRNGRRLLRHDGRFDIEHDGTGAFCTGSYAVTGHRARLVAERSGSQLGCFPGRFLEATFALTDDGLGFREAAAHTVDTVLFASRHLLPVEE